MVDTRTRFIHPTFCSKINSDIAQLCYKLSQHIDLYVIYPEVFDAVKFPARKLLHQCEFCGFITDGV